MKAYQNFLKETFPGRHGTGQDIDAYLAGFFDGEGHISIRRDPRRPWSCYVDVGATNTDRSPLYLLRRAYGGKIRQKPAPKNRKKCYVWICSAGKDALWAISRMLPWLRVKRKKARIALIVLRNRPLRIAGGQISKHQKMAISKALAKTNVIKISMSA